MLEMILENPVENLYEADSYEQAMHNVMDRNVGFSTFPLSSIGDYAVELADLIGNSIRSSVQIESYTIHACKMDQESYDTVSSLIGKAYTISDNKSCASSALLKQTKSLSDLAAEYLNQTISYLYSHNNTAICTDPEISFDEPASFVRAMSESLMTVDSWHTDGDIT